MKEIVFSLSIVALIMTFVTIKGEAFPKDGLVLHLNFDKSAIQDDKVKDQSAQSNDGIINGGAKVVAGKFGEALEFDGVGNFVEIPLTDSITFTKGSSFTAQVWIKTDDKPPQNDGLVGNYRPSTDALWILSVRGDDPASRGKMGFSVRDKETVA
jgi:hypothetical protein